MSGKREDYLCWHDYFMAVAFLSAQRSKDPSSQVGACIVNEDNKIVGIGYNGMPTGCDDDALPWARQAASYVDTKYPYVCHAELNAILNKNSATAKGCKIYVALFPCNECAKLIIQSGITEVIFMSDKYHDDMHYVASRRLLDLASVKYWQYTPQVKRVIIDFSSISVTTVTAAPGTRPAGAASIAPSAQTISRTDSAGPVVPAANQNPASTLPATSAAATVAEFASAPANASETPAPQQANSTAAVVPAAATTSETKPTPQSTPVADATATDAAKPPPAPLAATTQASAPIAGPAAKPSTPAKGDEAKTAQIANSPPSSQQLPPNPNPTNDEGCIVM